MHTLRNDGDIERGYSPGTPPRAPLRLLLCLVCELWARAIVSASVRRAECAAVTERSHEESGQAIHNIRNARHGPDLARSSINASLLFNQQLES